MEQFNIESTIEKRIEKLDMEVFALRAMLFLAETELRGLYDLKIQIMEKAGEPAPVEVYAKREQLNPVEL